ncbi:MAG: putative glycoside hydrolase [Anaerolineae bacterium]
MSALKHSILAILLSTAVLTLSVLALRSTSQPAAQARPIDEVQSPTVTSTVYLPLIRNAVGRPWPDTTNGIYVLNDQLATWSMSEAQFQFAATHYVGTQKVTRDQARHLRQYNPNFLVLHYRLAQALGHSLPNACAPTIDYLQIIDGDQWVQEWPGNAVVQENWFYHYPSSRVFSCTDGHYLMELNDAGWRQWWSTQVISQLINNEDDALFADSFSVPNYFGDCAYHPCLPIISSTFELAWADREHAFTDYMQARFAGRWKWLPNIGAWITSRDPSDYSNLDGAMLEGFAEWGGGNYFDVSDWELQMNRVLPLIRNDKIIIGQTYPVETDVNERLFALGTYLLIKGTHTYINLDIVMEPEWFPEYAIDLGRPIDLLPVTIDGLFDATSQLYVRHYAKGMVIVNPASDAHTINLGGTYYQANPSGGGIVPADGLAPGTINYAAVTSINLGAHQAAVVLNVRP